MNYQLKKKNHRPKEEKNGTTNEEKNQGPKDMDQGEGVIDLQHTPPPCLHKPRNPQVIWSMH